jgi:cbb3-type cytochrome oxidase maturation protein
MSIIFFILPITLLLSLAAVVAFTWATRAGQFDDLQTPAIRALHEPISNPRPPIAHEAAHESRAHRA